MLGFGYEVRNWKEGPLLKECRYDSGNFPKKVSISGPCSNPRQYNEIQNVKIWLQCLTALTGRDEDEILHEIHQEFSNLNDVSPIRQP